MWGEIHQVLSQFLLLNEFFVGKVNLGESHPWTPESYTWSPIRQTALSVGHHFLISFIQLAKVDLGTRTM